MKKGILFVGFVIALGMIALHCGGGGGGGSGSGNVEGRADLSGAMGSSSDASGDGANSGAGSAGLAVAGLVKNQATTVSCEPQGTITLDIAFGDSSIDGDTLTLDITITGTASDCGEDHFTGSFTETGSFKVNSESGKVDGDLTVTMSGSTSACSNVMGDLTADIDIEGESGSIKFDGTISGTCNGEAAECTFDGLTINLSDSPDSMKEKFCEACDVPSESCS